MNNIDRVFLDMFPDGLEDTAWNELGKKHNPNKIFKMFENELSKDNLKHLIDIKKYGEVLDISLAAIKKSSVVSVFEKVAFQNFVKYVDRKEFAEKFYNFLYNYNDKSFEEFVTVLISCKKYKNANPAKWPVISFFKAYQNPEEFVIVKPNTVKAVAKFLDFDIEYKPLPNTNTYKNVLNMVKEYQQNSSICKNENLMITQAVLFVVAAG